MPKPRTTRVALRVQPNASRSEVSGWHGQSLRVRVAAPATDGRANAAVVNTLAEMLGIHRADIRIVRGLRSRDKVAEVAGMDTAELCRLLPDTGTNGQNSGC